MKRKKDKANSNSIKKAKKKRISQYKVRGVLVVCNHHFFIFFFFLKGFDLLKITY
jgi:hypothetical protein